MYLAGPGLVIASALRRVTRGEGGAAAVAAPAALPGGLALGIPVVENQALRWPWLTNVYITLKAVSWNRVMQMMQSLFQIGLNC